MEAPLPKNSGIKHFTIRDHNEDEVCIAWCPENNRQDALPPFPFQVYLLSSAEQLAKNVQFPCDFAAFVQSHKQLDDRYRCHFQIYQRTFPNILACVAHQRREVLYRNRNGITPRMVARWIQLDLGDKGRILVVDSDGWAHGRLVVVTFDPVEYDNRAQFVDWNMANDGDIDLVHAHRCHSMISLMSTLRQWWSSAGGSWTEDDLQRRNDGGTSPVLYPAIDPASHHDAEHEEVHELDGTALPGPAGQADDENIDDGQARIIDTFDPSDLFLQEHELREYRTESYSDVFGLPVMSVWSARLSRLRPKFSFTLYLAFDFFEKVAIRPKALFRCLSKGLIAQEAWTLDIVKNMPSLDAAFQYHARATAQRTSARCERRRECFQLILQRIAGWKLPSEILEHIEDLLLPPEIPSYSASPIRKFKDVFLYLDKGRQYTGPLIVYSNPDKSRIDYDTNQALASANGDRSVRTFSAKSVLRVVYQRYWHRVADELHVLWSLCSPRCIETEEMIFPTAELKLAVPEACVWRSQFGIQYINGYLDLEISFHSDREIVLPCHGGLFSDDLWNEHVDTIDVETGNLLPPLCNSAQSNPVCLDSWDQSRRLGFRSGANVPLDPDKNFRSFKADETCKLELRPSTSWWHRQLGTLKGGREYAFRLKAGISIPRWTYGTIEKREGPFNLPPIPITVDETLRPFKFRVESVGAPHGSFNR